MATFLQVVRDIALVLARVGLGGVLILHGWRRWQVQGIGKQVEYLKQFGTPFPHYAAWGGTMFELIGGVFLVVGALTPLVAAIVVAQQVLTIAWTSWYKGFYLTDSSGAFRGGYEYAVVLGLLALLFVVFGAGRASVDQLFKRSPRDRADDREEPPQSDRPRNPRTASPGAPPHSGTAGPAQGSTGASRASGADAETTDTNPRVRL